jgi:hypothetical protein
MLHRQCQCHIGSDTHQQSIRLANISSNFEGLRTFELSNPSRRRWKVQCTASTNRIGRNREDLIYPEHKVKILAPIVDANVETECHMKHLPLITEFTVKWALACQLSPA